MPDEIVENGWLVETIRIMKKENGSEMITYKKVEKYKPVVRKLKSAQL
jgi:hypothetical protein